MITTAHTVATGSTYPTVWGLDPLQLHDRFWAARGVQVVRQGEPSEIVADAELFLLADPRTLTIFRLGELVDQMSWLEPDIVFVRLHDVRERGYREVAGADDRGNLTTFRREYGGVDSRLARVALTPMRELARVWQNARDARAGWRLLRRSVRPNHRTAASIPGWVYDRADDRQVGQCVRDLVRVWKSPEATIGRAFVARASVWQDPLARVEPGATFIGPVWVGAGRRLEPTDSVVGPTVLWDDPTQRPAAEHLEWDEIEPTDVLGRAVRPKQLNRTQRALKRTFDIAFALVLLALTLPLYPLIALAIMIEDGWPVFFTHSRETLGGRRFPCFKFRSMYRNAEQRAAQFQNQNVSDARHVYIKNDPRVTKVGKLLRDLNLDELPQFLNVLAGHMSIVGPRPSPYSENQFCPAWREARLSVRPGITGLWQVRRSRAPGLDFQEWIRYDIEYVERMSWRLDLWIMWQTLIVTVRKVINP